MKRNKNIKFVLPLFAVVIPSLLFAPQAVSGGFGAEIE